MDKVKVQVGKLQEVEGEMSRITEGTNSNMEELVQLVKENEGYVQRQGELAREEFQQQMVATLLRSDRDGDMKVTAREVNILVARFKGKRGVDIDGEKLRSSIESSDGSLKSIMDLLRDFNVGT